MSHVIDEIGSAQAASGDHGGKGIKLTLSTESIEKYIAASQATLMQITSGIFTIHTPHVLSATKQDHKELYLSIKTALFNLAALYHLKILNAQGVMDRLALIGQFLSKELHPQADYRLQQEIACYCPLINCLAGALNNMTEDICSAVVILNNPNTDLEIQTLIKLVFPAFDNPTILQLVCSLCNNGCQQDSAVQTRGEGPYGQAGGRHFPQGPEVQTMFYYGQPRQEGFTPYGINQGVSC